MLPSWSAQELGVGQSEFWKIGRRAERTNLRSLPALPLNHSISISCRLISSSSTSPSTSSVAVVSDAKSIASSVVNSVYWCRPSLAGAAVSSWLESPVACFSSTSNHSRLMISAIETSFGRAATDVEEGDSVAFPLPLPFAAGGVGSGAGEGFESGWVEVRGPARPALAEEEEVEGGRQ